MCSFSDDVVFVALVVSLKCAHSLASLAVRCSFHTEEVLVPFHARSDVTCNKDRSRRRGTSHPSHFADCKRRPIRANKCFTFTAPCSLTRCAFRGFTFMRKGLRTFLSSCCCVKSCCRQYPPLILYFLSGFFRLLKDSFPFHLFSYSYLLRISPSCLRVTNVVYCRSKDGQGRTRR